MANKGNVKPSGETYDFSTGDIVHYLENEVLGFRIKPDFMRWDGYNGNSYVRMRVVIQAKDLIVDRNDASVDYATRFLMENKKGYSLDKGSLASLEPFMYPKDFTYDQITSESLTHLNLLGVSGERLEELIKYSKLTLVGDPKSGNQYFIVYLRPERIIFDMLRDVKTNKLEGHYQIRYVAKIGQEPNTDLIWFVTNNLRANNEFGIDLSMDKLFALKR